MTMNLGKIELRAYEWTGKKISGFKFYREGEQVGTIEKRGARWIGATMLGNKVETFEYEEFERAFDELVRLSA